MIQTKKRDLSIDVMRGIAILAVFVGHFAIFPQLHLARFAFSFRMPLLIMIGGIFFKEKTLATQIKGEVTRLLLPCLFTVLICAVLSYFAGMGFIDLFVGLYGNAVKADFVTMWQGPISCIGVLWFLPGIFWCKIIYNILFKIKLNRYIFTIFVFVISIITIYGSRYLILPFGISHGLSMLMFYHLGVSLKVVPKSPFRWWMFIVGLVLWLLSFVFAVFSIGEFYYEILLLNIFGVIGAFYCIYWFSKLIVRWTCIPSPLRWCGQNSMALYCFHAVCFYVVYLISGQPGEWTPWNPHLMFVIHLVFCLSLTYISSKVPFLKRLYKIVDYEKEKSSIC